jgi:hypothetical protein
VTRPPRIGVAPTTSNSKEQASCAPSTTSSSHCMSPSMSWWSPAAGRADAPGCRTPSWSAWPWPRCCWAMTPNAAGCGSSVAGWDTCSPMSAGRRPTTAGCAARGRWWPASCAPWRSARRGGVTSGACWTRPRSRVGRAGRPSSAASWPAGPATAGTPAITASTGDSSCTCWPPLTAAGRVLPGKPERRRAGGGRGAVGPRRPPGVLGPGMVVLADKGLAGREFDALVGELGATLARPDRTDEPYRFGSLAGSGSGWRRSSTPSKTSWAWNATAPIPSKAFGSARAATAGLGRRGLVQLAAWRPGQALPGRL